MGLELKFVWVVAKRFLGILAQSESSVLFVVARHLGIIPAEIQQRPKWHARKYLKPAMGNRLVLVKNIGIGKVVNGLIR